MTGTTRATALRRASLCLCATLGVAAIATPALASDTTNTVRLRNIAAPTTPAEEAMVRTRVARAAMQACDANDSSAVNSRYLVSKSECFRTSVDTAMARLNERWGAAAAGGGSN